MNWLYQLVKAVLDSLIDYLATRPQPTIENAQTPEATLKRWRQFVADKLRDKGSSN